MAFSRSTRIITLLVIDTLFFLLEIIVGCLSHSLALIADSFHMLNDVFSLLVALWAIRLATRKGNNEYTYGWQRAEVLGALINGVFLLALCLSIFLEAIQRFVDPQPINQPILVLAVGSAGLASNILGLFLFHEHGHSHGDDGHGHGHGEDVEAEAGDDGYKDDTEETLRDENGDIQSVLPASVIRSLDSRRHTREYSVSHSIHAHPAQNRAAIQAFGGSSSSSSTPSESAISDTEVDDENTSLLRPASAPRNGHHRDDSTTWHRDHEHSQPKKKSSGHSHQSLNMRGVFLHVLGDALGNVGVILTALFVKYGSNYKPFEPLVDYADPFISLVITVIIFSSALPLCKSASKILLQAVPSGLKLAALKKDIASMPDVESVHELHIWQLSDVKMIASLHIQIKFDPEEKNGGRYMRLARNIRKCLHAVGVHSSTIQPEYIRPDHDSYGSIPSEAAESCAMECTVDCGGGKCCGPSVKKDDDDHGHAH